MPILTVTSTADVIRPAGRGRDRGGGTATAVPERERAGAASARGAGVLCEAGRVGRITGFSGPPGRLVVGCCQGRWRAPELRSGRVVRSGPGAVAVGRPGTRLARPAADPGTSRTQTRSSPTLVSVLKQRRNSSPASAVVRTVRCGDRPRVGGGGGGASSPRQHCWRRQDGRRRCCDRRLADRSARPSVSLLGAGLPAPDRTRNVCGGLRRCGTWSGRRTSG